jgi:hypothetical protein
MSASQYDFPIEKGSSFKLSLVYKDNNGNIIDITGYCARLTWSTDTGVTTTFTTDNVDLSEYSFTIDGPTGKITLLIPASKTETFAFDNARYDLELHSNIDLYTGGGKEVNRIIYGTINIIRRNSDTTTTLAC